MTVPHWFNEKLIDTDAKAFGVYLALLKARFTHGWWDKEVRPIPPIVDDVRWMLQKSLTGKDMLEAFEAVRDFMKLLNEYEYGKLFLDKSFLDEIEIKYYEKFRRACYRYFKRDAINEEIRDYIRLFLKDVKAGVYKRILMTKIGSVHIYSIASRYLAISKDFERYCTNLQCEKDKIVKIAKALIESGIVVFGISVDIIPAPFLEDEFIEKLAPPEEFEEKKEEIIKEGLEKKYEGKSPDWRILEEIVKDVLKDLGFKVETNKKLKAKGGGDIEVDVWGIKFIGNTRFYVYASCKNWDREVDRTVIDGEYGRTLQLIQSPHLKIFIAKKLTEPARETALADGFIVIELGEKASSENAGEIYNLIYSHLKELFIGIAPPELQRFAKEAKEISERLKNLAEEIERLSG